jgi:hypothetical protein
MPREAWRALVLGRGVGVSTHQRAWILRAAVVAVVAAGSLFGLASPALAAPGEPQLSDISLDPGTINAGSETTVHFTVKLNPDAAGLATVTVTSNDPKVTCSATCSFSSASIPLGGKVYAIKMKASGPYTNDDAATITIKATNTFGTAQDQEQLNVKAPTQQASVPEVSGSVVDVYTNAPIKAAKVWIQDSASTTWEVGTDDGGNFKITNKPEMPIKPGTMSFKVEKDGIQPYTTTKTATAGQPLTGVKLTVAPINSPTPTSQPTQQTTESAPPTLGDDTPASTKDNSGGGLSWVLIAIGAFLVLLGVGAIVLLFVRKKDDGAGDGPGGPRRGGPGGPPPPPGRGGPRPPQRPGMPPIVGQPPPRPGGPPPGHGYDPTRPMRPPVSPGPRGDQTMIAPSPLAGAPTQLHGRVPEPDPYGRQNGYGPAGYPGGAGYGQPDQYGQQGYGQNYGQGTEPGYGEPQYGQPYGQQPPDQYGYDQRGQRPPQPPAGGDGRRVDWLDD